MAKLENPISADSTDVDIRVALMEVGEQRLPHRKGDWPTDGHPGSWVRPDEIGISTRKDRSLAKRLLQMVEDRLLEKKPGELKFRVAP